MRRRSTDTSERLDQVLKYTHRVAIANQRLVAVDAQTVRFRWKDYTHGACERIMTLDAVEFLRRFLQHVLPTGLVRIRYYGFLANGRRTQTLARIRTFLAGPAPPLPAPPDPAGSSASVAADVDPTSRRCPACHHGRLRWVETLPPATGERPAPQVPDTS